VGGPHGRGRVHKLLRELAGHLEQYDLKMNELCSRIRRDKRSLSHKLQVWATITSFSVLYFVALHWILLVVAWYAPPSCLKSVFAYCDAVAVKVGRLFTPIMPEADTPSWFSQLTGALQVAVVQPMVYSFLSIFGAIQVVVVQPMVDTLWRIFFVWVGWKWVLQVATSCNKRRAELERNASVASNDREYMAVFRRRAAAKVQFLLETPVREGLLALSTHPDEVALYYGRDSGEGEPHFMDGVWQRFAARVRDRVAERGPQVGLSVSLSLRGWIGWQRVVSVRLSATTPIR
jgi:hypothetical protein